MQEYEGSNEILPFANLIMTSLKLTGDKTGSFLLVPNENRVPIQHALFRARAVRTVHGALAGPTEGAQARVVRQSRSTRLKAPHTVFTRTKLHPQNSTHPTFVSWRQTVVYSAKHAPLL